MQFTRDHLNMAIEDVARMLKVTEEEVERLLDLGVQHGGLEPVEVDGRGIRVTTASVRIFLDKRDKKVKEGFQKH